MDKKMISLHMEGIDPEAQARPRIFRTSAGAVRAHSPKTAFYSALTLHALSKRPAAPLDGPISLVVCFIFARPKSVKGIQQLKWSKPDLDNLLKAAKDSLTAAKWWVDDSRVSSVSCSKVYAAEGQKPGVWIRAWQAEDPAWLKA